ncbi:MAG: tetratricopeptide repeat protein, partial [Nitrospinales bacterium]
TLIVPESWSFLWNRLGSVLMGPYFGLIFCFQPWLIGFAGLFYLQPEKLVCKPLPGGKKPGPWEFLSLKWILILLAFIPFYLTLTWTLAENSSYGRRLLIASMPCVAFGFAALYDRFRRTKWAPVLPGLAVLSVVLNLAQMVQFRWKLNYFDPDYSLKAIKNIPDLFAEPATGLLSTSLVKVAAMEGFSVDSPTDILFVAGVPFALAVLMGVGLALIGAAGTEKPPGGLISRTRARLPVALAAGTAVVSLYLSVSYKTFSQEELDKRKRFAAIIQNYPEFIFDNAAPGNGTELLEAVRLNPRSSRAFLQLGFYHFKTGDLEKAAWHYRRALDLDRTNHNAWWAMGQLLKRTGDKAYMGYLAEALRLQPHRHYRQEYLFETGNQYFFRRQYEQAVETLKKVVQLAPAWALPYANIAVNYYCLDDLEKAEEYALKAKSLGSEAGEILAAIKQKKKPRTADR